MDYPIVLQAGATMLDHEALRHARHFITQAEIHEAWDRELIAQSKDPEHRGTILFWRATAALLVGDVQAGFMLMHAAYQFDAARNGDNALTQPAALFVLLEPEDHALSRLTKHYLKYILAHVARAPGLESLDVRSELKQAATADDGEWRHANHVFQLARFVALADQVERTQRGVQDLNHEAAAAGHGLRSAVQAHVLLSGLAVCESWGLVLAAEASGRQVTSLPAAVTALLTRSTDDLKAWCEFKKRYNKLTKDKPNIDRRRATITTIEELRAQGPSRLSDLQRVYVLRNHHAHSADPLPGTAEHFNGDVGAILRTLFRFLVLEPETATR